jgi:hypothetical protein
MKPKQTNPWITSINSSVTSALTSPAGGAIIPNQLQNDNKTKTKQETREPKPDIEEHDTSQHPSVLERSGSLI